MGAWPWSRKAEVETRDLSGLSIGDPATAMLLGYQNWDGGPSVTENTAMTLSAVYRAVSLISGSIAALPLRTLVDAEGQRTRVNSFLDAPAGPDNRLTPYEWKELALVHQLLHGNAYLQHIRNGANALIGLWPVHPSCVTPEWDSDRPGGKRFDVNVRDGAEQKKQSFDSTSMTQIMGLSLDGLQGLSPIALARQGMGTALSGDKAAHKMFVNGSLVGGLVTADEDVDEDDATKINSDLRNTAGTDSTGALVFVNRKLKFQQWQLSAVDAQFLQSRSFQIEEIARWYGIPPHLLGQTDKQTSWGTGVAEQNRGLARYTLTPYSTRFEQRLTPLLPGGKFAEFDYTSFIKPSPEVEIDLLLKQIAGGLLTPNEARAIRNLESVDGGDELKFPQTPAPGGPASSPGAGHQEVAA